MPTWKKVVISGSGVAQLSNDANYLVDAQSGAILSGSFSGSFVGDGSGLTNIVAPGTISSSAQIASDISGAFAADSASFSTRVTDLETFSSSLDNTFASEAELNASSSTLQSNINGVQSNLDTASGSLAGRLATIEGDNATQTELDAVSASLAADISGLGDTYATDAELNASSSTLQTNIDGVQTNLDSVSSSLAADITSNDTDISALQSFSSSVDTAMNFNGTNVTIVGNLEVSGTTTTVDSTTVTFADNIIALNGTGAANGGIQVNDANGPASGSFLWDGTNNRWIAGGEGSEVPIALLEGQSLVSSSAQIQELGFASDAELNASSSTLQSNLDTASGSLAGRIATIEGDNATQTELDAVSSSLATSIDTVASDLSTASGSLAGRLATIEGDNATQTELDAVSASLAADISGLGDTYATDAELNASSSTLQTNIDNASSSLAANIASNDVDIAALQTFSSSVDTALDFSGTDVTVAGNLTVNGTGSFSYIQSVTGSAKIIGDAYIVLNNDTPTERYAGLKVYDSGSANTTASLEFDGQTNNWFYEYSDDGGVTTDHGVVLFGPEYSDKGSPAYPTNNALLKGTGGHHLSASLVTDDGSTIGLGANTSVTGNITVTGTVDGIDLQAFSGSASTRITDLETFSSSLDNTFASEAELNASSSALTTAFTDADTTLSASLATDIAANASNLANLTSGELNSGSFNVTLDPVTGSIAFTEGLEIGDVYDQGNGTTDIRVPAGASWLELNHGDSDFIYLDGSNAGINLDNNYEWTFYGASGLLNAPGEIRIPAANVFSGSVSGPTVTATTINGTINADNNVVSSSAQTIANLGGSGVVSGSAEGDAQGQIKLNGINVDINALGASDSPTFNNLTVNGNLTTLGTVTNVNATDLNVEDKFILLNSGSSTGNSGLIVQTSATVGQGSALFWDDATDRWSLDFSGADSTADTATADAYVAAVVTSDDVNYQKVGNIRVDTGTGEAYIYTA